MAAMSMASPRHARGDDGELKSWPPVRASRRHFTDDPVGPVAQQNWGHAYPMGTPLAAWPISILLGL